MSSIPVVLPLSDAAKSAAALKSGTQARSPAIERQVPLEWSPSCALAPRLHRNFDFAKLATAWQSKPMKQSVIYDDQAAVEKALRKLEALPPLVTAMEVRTALLLNRGVMS